MAIYKCECGKTKEIGNAKMRYIEKKWRVMPTIKRTESSLSKKNKGDYLWDSAKEKLVGERGVNEDYK